MATPCDKNAKVNNDAFEAGRLCAVLTGTTGRGPALRPVILRGMAKNGINPDGDKAVDCFFPAANFDFGFRIEADRR